MPWGPFQEQQIYNRRRDIHGHFGGQEQGGICTPSQHPVIFLFTGHTGEQHGYADGWSEGVFRYFGEGQVGDMQFQRGNRAVRDHLKDGKDLLLFKILNAGAVRYLGQFDCAGYSLENAPGRDGLQRSAIVFELLPADPQREFLFSESEASPAREDGNVALDVLRARALEAAQSSPRLRGQKARRSLYRRAAAVRRYVLARAQGVCEACGVPAPFATVQGEPYLEPHHIRRLSDGGPDNPHFIAALCPNCHREVHYGADGPTRNQLLLDEIRRKEAHLGRQP